MKVLIVGGNWGHSFKKSSVMQCIYEEFLNAPSIARVRIYNGGTIDQLEKLATSKELLSYDLILWTPNVNNDESKFIPIKKKGATLIISKRMRETTSEFDAISRIFKFNGNAVITIHEKEKRFYFRLIDALANIWVTSDDIKILMQAIKELTEWTAYSLRVPLTKREGSNNISHLDKLIELNKEVAIKCKKEFNTRFFGNLSTRCMKLFPSLKTDAAGSLFLVSARNVDKEFLTKDDMILVDTDFSYVGDKKPSVDTPVQINLYNKFPSINYMIHGHAYIEGAVQTEKYRPCGDLWESDEVYAAVFNSSERPFNPKNVCKVAINLKNHGFIFMASTIELLEELCRESMFVPKGIEPYTK